MRTRLAQRLPAGDSSRSPTRVRTADWASDRAGVEDEPVPDVAREHPCVRVVEIIDDGTNRRTNVDAVSPVLVALGALVIMLIAVVAGLQAGRWELRTAAVRFTTGFRPLNTLRSAAARVALIGTARCTTALAGAAVVRQTTTLDLDVTTAVIAVGSVVFAVSVASFWQGSRRWNC